MRPQEKYDKENMAIVKGKYKKEFVEEFKNACAILDTAQSHVIKQAMINTIKEAKERNMEIKFNIYTGWFKSFDEAPSNEDDTYFDNLEDAKKYYSSINVSGNEFKVLEKVTFENGKFYDTLEEIESTYSSVWNSLYK